MVTKKFAGQDIIVFRTESGKACVIDAYCPHMGAHFGHGGCVIEEGIKCPFHGFEFNTDGKCTKTGYNTDPPLEADATIFPCQEVNGLILLFSMRITKSRAGRFQKWTCSVGPISYFKNGN